MKKTILLSILILLIGLSSFAQWMPQNSGTSNYLYSVFFIDINTGFACGSGGIILKTMDGGEIWVTKNSGTTNYLGDITFLTADTGYAVGNAGTILKTTDGGETWVLKPSGVTSYLSRVCFIGTVGFTVGQHGTILKTTDGGETWIPQSSLTTLPLRQICFPTVDSGYAVGGLNFNEKGIILRTTNGGLNWETVSEGAFNCLVSVSFTSSSTGYAAGGDANSATLLKTNDAGMTWNIIPGIATIPYTLKRVYFPDADTGYVVGNNGTILETYNAGNTWITQTSGTNENLFGLFFNNANEGYAVGNNGVILKTTNGGGPPVGIKEKQKLGSFTIYPSPANEKIIIELPEYGSTMNGLVSIIGMTGQELIRQHFQQRSVVEVNVSCLLKGAYFVRLMNSEKTWIGKFIKE